MPIDTSTPRSPGWWLERLAKKLLNPVRQDRLALLDAIYRGDPPLPVGAEAHRETYRAFQRYARSNFGELIVEAARERMIPIGIRTSADSDETGDAEAWRVWERAGLDIEAAEVHRTMLAMGNAYVIIGARDDETGVPVITAEDPRQVVTEHDPRQQRKIVAALKMFTDDVDNRELAYLYLPGQLFVAWREAPVMPQHSSSFDPYGWEWDEQLSGPLPDGLMPVVRFRAARGVGLFEPHQDLLMRINHMILQRMVIATLQAFRQRAVEGLPETVDGKAPLPDDSNVIDYTDVFSADPGALWQVPEGVKFWESGQVDLTPILASVREDVKHLAAVSRTPMHMLDPSGENQSAEGAALSREGLVFKVEDLIVRASASWNAVMSIGFRWMGDEQRADPSALRMQWRPPERLSIAERADAASKAGTDIPLRTKLISIWGFTPTEVDRMESERNADFIRALTQQVAPTGAPVV